MKILKRIIIWLVVILALLIVVAYLLPGTYKVERSALIKGDGDMIYNMVCDYHNWDFWTPWSMKDDSTLVEEIIGTCELGAVHRWDGEKMGKGEMVITELVPGEKIMWDLKFDNFDRKMIIGMYFEPEGDDWVVTWTAEGELGYNPLYRYYGLMIDSELGGDYEKGLQSLAEFCEQLPDHPGISITELSPMPALSVKDSVSMAEMGPFMETYFPALYMYAIRKGGNPAGHPYSIYYNWDPAGKIFMEVGVPLAEAIEGEDNMMPATTPGGKAVKAVHYGPYEGLAESYGALEKYMTAMQLEPLGLAYEVYITDPTQEPDTSKWETHIYFPLK